ncbi:hypothetical protein HELRODRAFT_188483 [Helobdella robusta]|uniref:LRRCT domain-containing protein n=1 Tax=Helobdella robusta TaxID=6412 RepID=T1FQ15_HELRO|nr:hypothetical protein HELRODRAFT_188483 [Helobdella robusta]ESO01802.1 hypothetical protein HELRODRAFT_188483 [Helobdella robusta]
MKKLKTCAILRIFKVAINYFHNVNVGVSLLNTSQHSSEVPTEAHKDSSTTYSSTMTSQMKLYHGRSACNTKQSKFFDASSIIITITLSIMLAAASSSSSSLVFSMQCPKSCACWVSETAEDVQNYHATCGGTKSPLIQIPPNLPGQLTHLDLSYNNIEEIKLNSALINLNDLRHLNLSHNQIGSIEEKALSGMKNLQILDLSHNQLSTFEQKYFAVQQQQNNNNNNNGNNDGEDSKLFNDDGLYVPDHVDADDYKEDEDENYDTTEASVSKNLREIDLSNNKLTDVDLAFIEMLRLEKLNLDGNKLNRLTDFTFVGLKRLKSLSISSNSIEEISDNTFTNFCNNLISLIMRNNTRLNKLTHLNISNCHRLNYLDLSDCNLQLVPQGLSQSLRYLQLRRNRINEIGKLDFQQCNGLNILLLDGNNIQSLHDNSIEVLTNLQNLWLNGNQLKKPPFRIPSSLTRLLVDDNAIEEWSVDNNGDQLNNSLSFLSLTGNKIKEINSESFKTYSNLANLDIGDNKIEKLLEKSFENNKKLKVLIVNKNPIKYIDDKFLDELPQLKSLSISYIETPSHSLDARTTFLKPVNLTLENLEMDHSPSLIRLMLTNNDQSKYPSKHQKQRFSISSSLKALRSVSFVGADLTTLSKNDMHNFLPPILRNIKLTSNKWHCDKSLLWFREFLFTQKFDSSAGPNVCYTPRLLNGKSIRDLSPDDFVPIQVTTLKSSKNSNAHKTTKKSLHVFNNNDNKNIDRNEGRDWKKHSPTSTTAVTTTTSTTKTTTTTTQSLISENFIEPQSPKKKSKNNDKMILSSEHNFNKINSENFDIEQVDSQFDDINSEDDTNNNLGNVNKKDDVTNRPVVHVTDFMKLPNGASSKNIKVFEEENNDNKNGKESQNGDDGPQKNNLFSEVVDPHFSNNEKNVDNPINKFFQSPDKTDSRQSTDTPDVEEIIDKPIENSKMAVTIAIIIIIATVIIALFIISLIIIICRKKRKHFNSSDNGYGNKGTMMKSKHKDGVLYFSTASVNQDSSSQADLRSFVGSSRHSASYDKRSLGMADNNRSSPASSVSKHNTDARPSNGYSDSASRTGFNGYAANNNSSVNNGYSNGANNFYTNNKTRAYRWEEV